MLNTEKYPNLIKKRLKIKLTDFSSGLKTFVTENLLPMRYAINTYNFCYNEKGLIDGLGLRQLRIYNGNYEKTMHTPAAVDSVLGFWVYRQYESVSGRLLPMLMMYGDDGKLYFGRVSTNDNEFRDSGITASTLPTCLNYKLNGKLVFLCCTTNKISVFDTVQNQIFTENVPSIVTAATHAGRLFATVKEDGYRVYFSDELDPTNWNINEFDGGYIELNDDRGKLRKLIESNKYLYGIREFGISRISAWGLQSDFIVNNLYLSTGKIYANTATLCGSIILLLCKDGLYYFNGYSMQKIHLGFEKLFTGQDNENALGAFIDGKYYLACKLDFGDDEAIGCEMDEYKNNALVEYDLDSGNINILRGVDVSAMAPIQSDWFSKLVVCLRHDKAYELTRDGLIDGVATEKVWCSGYTDLGYPDRKKVLKKLYLDTKTDIVVKVLADDKEYNFEVKGDKVPVSVGLNLMAEKFNIVFKSETNNCEISDAQVEVDIC